MSEPKERKPRGSTLSFRRILISLLLIAMIPGVRAALNLLIHDDLISLTFALCLSGFLLVVYDWNLFGLHYNRSKRNIGDTLLYSLLGTAVIGTWTWVDQSFLYGNLLQPSTAAMKAFPFAAPAALIATSYVLAVIVNIGFKCLTDHIDVRSNEAAVILVSGFLFGAILTLLYTPFDLDIWIRTYLYNVILTAFLSYLYNQSSSFIPGILSMGTVLLVVNLLPLLK